MIAYSSHHLIKLRTVESSPLLVQQAREYFSALGVNIDSYFQTEESLIGRYSLSKELEKYGMSHFVPTGKDFSCGDFFFSTSHSKGKIFLALSRCKIAVDIEKIVPRDSTLLSQISSPLFSFWIEKYEEWKIFYLQRCARECFVKLLDLNFSKIEQCKIFEIQEKKIKV
jgi:phosphopantetheinyl transferase